MVRVSTLLAIFPIIFPMADQAWGRSRSLEWRKSAISDHDQVFPIGGRPCLYMLLATGEGEEKSRTNGSGRSRMRQSFGRRLFKYWGILPR